MSASGKDFWAPSGGSSPVPKCQVHWGEAPLAGRRKGVMWQSWGPGQWPQTPCPALSAPRHAPSWLKDAPAHRAPGTRAGSQGWLGLSANVKTRQESAVPRPSPCPGAWQPHSGLLVRAGRRRPGARPSSGPSRQGPGRGWAGAGREDTASPHTAEQGLPHERGLPPPPGPPATCRTRPPFCCRLLWRLGLCGRECPQAVQTRPGD